MSTQALFFPPYKIPLSTFNISCHLQVTVISWPKHKMPPKESKPVKGKGNLLKVPTKAEIDHDNSIAAMQWVWRSFFLLLAFPLRSML